MTLYRDGDSEMSRDCNDVQQNHPGTCGRTAEVRRGWDVMAGLTLRDRAGAEAAP